MTLITFLLAAAAAALYAWHPPQGAGKLLHLLLFITCGFLAGVFFLAGLFTLWWPPARPGVVFWSAAALGLQFITMAQRDGD